MRHGPLATAALVSLAALSACDLGEVRRTGREELRDDLAIEWLPTTAAGGRTGAVRFVIEPRTAAFQIEARAPGATFAIATLLAPDGADVADGMPSRAPEHVRGEAAWLVPGRAPSAPPAPGTWSVTVEAVDAAGAAYAGPIDLRVLSRRAVPEGALCELALDVVVAEDALPDADHDALVGAVVTRASEALAPAGLVVADHALAPLPGVDTRVELGGDRRGLERVAGDAAAALADAGLARPGAVRVVVVRSLGFGGGAGYALALPATYPVEGDPGTGATVLVAGDAIRAPDGALDVDRAAVIVAHEVGHALGLHHTTDADNLMTPGGDPGRRALSHAQSTIARRHPLCAPTTLPWSRP